MRGRLRHPLECLQFRHQVGQQGQIVEAADETGRARDRQAAYELVPQPLYRRTSQKRRVTSDPGLRTRHNPKTELGLQPCRAQEAHRVIAESPLTRGADEPCRQIGLTAQGVDQRACLVQGHGVDGEIPPGQVFLQACATQERKVELHTRHLLRLDHDAGRPPLLIKGKEEPTQCIADRSSQSCRIAIDGKVPIVQRPLQQTITDSAAHKPDLDGLILSQLPHDAPGPVR